MYLRFICMASVCALTACGGGSGGSSGSELTQLASLNDLPQNGTVRLAALVSSGSLPAGNPLNFTFSDVRHGNGVVTLEMVNGNVAAFALESSAGSSSVDCRHTNTDCTRTVSSLIADSPTNLVTVFDNTAGGFEHQSLALWGQLNPNDRQIGLAVAGVKTPDRSRLPGSATYRGPGIGYADVSGGIEAVESVATVTTDFATANLRLDGSFATNLSTSITRAAPELDATGTLSVTGTAMSGTISTQDLSGTTSAQLHGPAGEELGGAFSMRGSTGEYHGVFLTER